MTRQAIRGFGPATARTFLETATLEGVRHRQAIHDLAQLLLMRRVDRVSIADPKLLAYQATLWPHLAPIMDRQQADGAWAPLEQDRAGWFHTTPWVLVFLGYLGIDGTAEPAIGRAVSYFVEHLSVDGPQTYACRYAMFLRALLQLGFGDPQSASVPAAEGVRTICEAHLAWMLERSAHCRATSRRGFACCACALVKELLFLNEFPPSWRGTCYTQAVQNTQESLLASMDGPPHCSSGGRQWGELGYLRQVCPSWFEVLEALVGSGYLERRRLEPALTFVGSRCVESATWLCDYRAQRSVLLDGRRRTVSWLLNLEPRGKPSPWLSVCGLAIASALEGCEPAGP